MSRSLTFVPPFLSFRLPADCPFLAISFACDNQRPKTAVATSASASTSSNRVVPLRSQHTGTSSSASAALLRAQHTGGSAMAPIKRQNTGAPLKAPLPAAKRPAHHQVAQPTGTRGGAALPSSSSSALGDSTNSTTAGNVGGTGGMKIPAGWGGSATSASTSAYPTLPADGDHSSMAPATFVQPQYTGFRPNTRLSGGRE